MRIYFFDMKKITTYLSVLIGTILFVLFASFFRAQILDVFSEASNNLPIYSVDTTEKKVALTFDCAWGADDISPILNSLKKENAKATFFVVGEWIAKYPNQAKAIAAAGHEVANHSDTHPHMTSLSNEKINEEIKNADEKIEKITGQKNMIFRAPYGDYNNKLVDSVNQINHYCIQWDVDSLDWKDISAQEIYDRVMGKVRNGSIILLHNDTKYTAQILPNIVKGLREKGYTMVPVSQLIYKDNYYIDFEGRQHSKKL